MLSFLLTISNKRYNIDYMIKCLKVNIMSDRKSGFIRLKGNQYVSKNDPDFFQKYLEANPLLQKAFIEHGSHTPPVIEQDVEVKHDPIIETATDTKENRRHLKFMVVLLPIMLMLLLSVLGLFIHSTKDVHAQDESNSAFSLTDDQKLKLSLIQSGIAQYKVLNGRFPGDLNELSSTTPDNILSVVPSGFTYEQVSNNGYSVFPTSNGKKCVCSVEKLKLVFYPDTNELALVQGEEVMKVYSVASGKKGITLPFKKSNVTKRVVDPNGGKGVYGTRGIALTDNYAIHGTNREELVGQNVSNGCLRMKQVDIEELYPYVTIGMEFEVREGKPDQEKYTNGLPFLGKQVNKEREVTPKTTYKWNY